MMKMLPSLTVSASILGKVKGKVKQPPNQSVVIRLCIQANGHLIIDSGYVILNFKFKGKNLSLKSPFWE